MLSYLAVVGLAVVFAIVFALGQGFYWTYVSRREAERVALARRLGTLSQDEAESLFREKARDSLASALGGLGQHLEQTLAQAEATYSVTNLLGRCALVTLIVAAVLAFVGGVFAMVIAPIFGLIPYFIVRAQANSRARKLLEQLPDSLDLMARSLQAGLGLSDAFRLVAEEMPLPIAAEYGRVFEEVRFGRDYREALGHMLDRNPGIFELRIFVSSVLLQRETGGNLIEILNTIAMTIRNRFLFHAKVRALTAEAKFSALILGGLPLCVAGVLWFVNAGYLTPLWTDPVGYALLGYFFTSYGLGLFIMYQVSKVEV